MNKKASRAESGAAASGQISPAPELFAPALSKKASALQFRSFGAGTAARVSTQLMCCFDDNTRDARALRDGVTCRRRTVVRCCRARPHHAVSCVLAPVAPTSLPHDRDGLHQGRPWRSSHHAPPDARHSRSHATETRVRPHPSYMPGPSGHAENHLHGNIAASAMKVVEHLIPHVYLRGDTPNGD